MSTHTIFARFHHIAPGFLLSQPAAMSLMFGLATIPLITSVGAAIDFSRFNSVKADLQGALDSTALSLAKEAASDTNTQLQTDALAVFNATFRAEREVAQTKTVTATYTAATSSSAPFVTVNGCVTVPTVIMQIIGINSVNVCDSSTAKWGNTRLRVALVLDNTGSMSSSGKITALKTGDQ